MKIKKISITILCILLMIGIFPAGTFETKAATRTSMGIYENLKYEVYDNEWIQIYKCISDAEEIIIPDKIKGHPVTSIGYEAFMDCTHIKKIVIPDSVTFIGSKAFERCTKLTSITIGSGVKSINSAFDGCDNLVRVDITDVASWCNIQFGSASYYGNSNPLSQAKHLYLNGVEVTDLVIPEDVSVISDNAFSNCESIVSLTLHDNIEIGPNSFSGCSIKKLSFLKGTKTIDSGMVLSKNTLTEINIPNTVTTIGQGAFSDCSLIESISIPESITEIGPNAFLNCDKLKKVNITDLKKWCRIDFGSISPFKSNPLYYAKNLYLNNELVTTLDFNTDIIISEGALYGCESIKQVNINEKVTSIPEYSFYGLKGISNIEIPYGVSEIGKSAFAFCSELKSISLPDSIASIGRGAFAGCTSLVAVAIPNSVTLINHSTFSGCSRLSSIIIPDSVTVIGAAFNDCSSLTSVTIPNSVTQMSEGVFSGCSSLEEITLPFTGNTRHTAIDNYQYPFGYIFGGTKYNGGVAAYQPYYASYIPSQIEYGTYYIPSSLKKVTITDCTYIPYGAFFDIEGRNNLTDISISASVTSINKSAFYNCRNLSNITVDKDNPVYHSSGNCLIATNSKTLVLGCKNSVIPNDRSVTSIGVYAFITCTGLTSIDIPESVVKIDKSAFSGCKNLSTISIPKSVISIGDNAFDDCTGLKNIWYTGYKSDKTKINIGSSNERLTNAKWHYLICENDDHVFSVNGNSTCLVCGYSKAPSKPVLESKTNNSVTLVPTDGFEYSQDGKNWQISNIFENLTTNKTYTFYQRVKETETAFVSEASEALSVKFKKTRTFPSAPIVSSFTDTTVSLLLIDGCEYSIDGINWQTSNVFTNLNPGTNYSFYQRYAETDVYEASKESSVTSITTDKARQTQIPDAPTVKITGTNTITLNAVENCEYSKDGINWQASNIFGGLLCGTEYTFYQRYKETDTTYAGQSSAACKKKTVKGAQATPDAPTLLRKTDRSVALTQISGYEYSKDSINWQASNVFEGLSPETNYMFYQRKAETVTYFASQASAALIVKTLETVSINSISVTSYPNKLIYIKGEESIDVTGGKITLYYSDDTSSIISLTEDMVSGFNSNLVGDQEIMVSYSGKTTVFIITVTGKPEKYKPLTPSGPTLANKTSNSVTLTAISGYEYSCNGITWQSSNIFINLEPNREYNFYQRIAETENNYASESSDSISITTLKNTVSMPSAPVIESKTDNSITVIAANGFEYSIDTISWQSDNVFTNLKSDTEYMVYQRIKETDIAYASEASPGTKVKTDKGYIPGDIDSIDGITDADAVYLLMHTFFPDDYPVNQNCDFNGDGIVTDADAVYLLMFTFFPEDYPLH